MHFAQHNNMGVTAESCIHKKQYSITEREFYTAIYQYVSELYSTSAVHTLANFSCKIYSNYLYYVHNHDLGTFRLDTLETEIKLASFDRTEIQTIKTAFKKRVKIVKHFPQFPSFERIA